MLRRTLLSVGAGLAALLVAAPGGGAAAPQLTATQRRVADELVSVFENSTTSIRYGYVENLHDGCGYTAGRAGFCSATGDMLMVVEDYATRRPGNGLVRFLPVLRRRAADGSASTKGLGSAFVEAWRTASRDAQFRLSQDHIVDVEYFEPATRWAGAAGLTTPLGVAIFYDTAIEHGTASDPDSLPSLIARTHHRVGGLPANGMDEVRWLTAFLAERRADLLHPHNRARRVDWPESVGRVDALARLVRAGQLNLTPPVKVNPWGDETFALTG
ncbi:MAG TPA: chitosanase [Baekduia sp.]